MAKGRRDLRREARWRELVGQQSRSGLSVRAFCARERVTESAFYVWRRELRLRDMEPKTGRPAFVPVALPQTRAVEGDEHIVIELRGGRVLRLPSSLPTVRVAQLVEAVEGVS